MWNGSGVSPPWYAYLRQIDGFAAASETGLAAAIARIVALEARGLSVQGQMSIQSFGTDTVRISLVGDTDTPGSTYFYGTSAFGEKGWQPVANAVVQGTGVVLTVLPDTGIVEIAHADTSAVLNVASDNSLGVVIQDLALTFDTFGHVTAATVATTDLDLRYAPISGGGGSSRAPAINFPHVLGPTSVAFIGDTAAGSLGFTTFTANNVYWLAFVVPETTSPTSLGLLISTASAGKARVGIYADTPTGVRHAPGALIVGTADIDTGLTGTQAQAVTLTLTAGTMYWCAIVMSSAPTVAAAGASAAAQVPILGRTSTGVIIGAFTSTLAAGWTALPATGPALSATATSRPVAYCAV